MRCVYVVVSRNFVSRNSLSSRRRFTFHTRALCL